MTTERFEDILEDNIRMMEAGVGLEDCVARHPEHAEELREQLATVQILRAARMPAQPELSARARARSQLLAGVEQQRASRNGHEPAMVLPTLPFRLLGGGARRLALVPYALPAALALVLVGGAAFGVSAATGNGDPLAWLASSNSEAEVELHGTLTAIAIDSLTVETATGPVEVAITADTKFEDEQGEALTAAALSPGDAVNVHAVRAEDGSLTAREVEVEGLDDGAVDDVNEGNSGPGSVDDEDDGAVDDVNGDDVDDGATDDENEGDGNTGPGSVDDDAGDDNSGPGSVDDDAADDNSGPGVGDDDGREEDGAPGGDGNEGGEDHPDDDGDGGGGGEEPDPSGDDD